jgi:hypothetical protein
VLAAWYAVDAVKAAVPRVPPPPILRVFPSADAAKVIELFTVRVFPSRIVRVDPVAGVVRVTLLILVADATPRDGVVSDGLVERTTVPDPVLPVHVGAVARPPAPVEVKNCGFMVVLPASRVNAPAAPP